MADINDDADGGGPPITELSAKQRRVLGVLVEKGITTPESYPLTLKAVVAGCNQKSNREPVVNYSDDDAEDVLNELRELGLVAVVHTESGRTERFRHYVRKRFQFSEPQLAILIELLLRGRQSLGLLRTRASRMVPIDTLEQLRDEVGGLMKMNLVVADGPLERRGVEADHNLYTPAERARTGSRATPTHVAPADGDEDEPGGRADGGNSRSTQQIGGLEATVESLKHDNGELRAELSQLREEVAELRDRLDALRRELGA